MLQSNSLFKADHLRFVGIGAGQSEKKGLRGGQHKLYVRYYYRLLKVIFEGDRKSIHFTCEKRIPIVSPTFCIQIFGTTGKFFAC